MPPLPSSSETVPSDAPRDKKTLSRMGAFTACVGLGILGSVILRFLFASANSSYLRFLFRLDVVLVVAFLAAFCLEPALTFLVWPLQKHWRNAYTCAALLGICAFLWVFLVHAGRWQFGGYDLGILVETGWRQIQGQRPYVDFPTTTPPGFNLGILYAYRLFGVSWDANLYFSALFACLTFLWMYWLMLRLSLSRLPAMAMSFAIECAAMLTLCFWWYNDSVLVLATVFFLSCLAYARQPQAKEVQASYLLSLALLSLMKPNMAGLTIAGGVLLLFLVTRRKLRLVLLTLGAAAAAVLFLLANGVSIPAMLTSYLSVAREHGSVSSRFGWQLMSRSEQYSALFWIAVLSIPLLSLIPRMFRLAGERDWRGIAYCLFFPLALIVALYGLATNGEYRDVECTLLLAAGAVLTFGLRWNGPLLRRIYIAIVCASIAGDLYYGADRARVYGIGDHMFFEWQNNRNRIEDGYLKNMRVSSTMIEVEREIKLAADSNPGPYFFGPRIDFNYAVLGLPSPEHFPAWWQPGTSFAISDQVHLIQVWRDHRFQTLIFLNSAYLLGSRADEADYFGYSKEFRDAINRDYVRDERYPRITVYHRRVAPDRP